MVEQGRKIERLAAEVEPDADLEAPAPRQTERTPSTKNPSKATRAVELAVKSGAEFWHDPDDEPYADVWEEHGVRRTIPIPEQGVSNLDLWTDVPRRKGQLPGGQPSTDAVDVLSAKAVHDGPERTAYVRIAPGPDGSVYLDLGDSTWKAIKITGEGWEIVTEPPVRFRRPRALRPLPVPERGRGLDELSDLLSIAEEEDRILIVSWLLGALHPSGPYPILDLTGEHGTAKTTTARTLPKHCGSIEGAASESSP